MTPSLRRRGGIGITATAVLLAAGLAAGAYAAAQSAAEQAFAEAMARLRALLPPETRLEHGAVAVEPLSGRILVADLLLGPRDSPEERLHVSRLVLQGLRPGGSGVGVLAADTITLTVMDAGRLHRVSAIGALRLEGLALPAEGEPFDPAALRLEALEIADWSFTPAQPDTDPSGRLGRLLLAAIGGDRPDRLALEALDLRVPGLPAGDRLAIGRVEVENIRLLPLILALAAGQPPAPPPGGYRLVAQDMSLHEGGAVLGSIRRVTAEGDTEGSDPARLRGRLAIQGIEIPLPAGIGPFPWGDSHLRADIGLAVEARPASGDVDLQQLRLALAEAGTFDLALRLSGVTVEATADPLRHGRLHGFTFRYTDAGLLSRALEQGAKQGGLRAEDLRRQITEAASALFSGPAAAANAAALRRFLERPGTLEIAARPAAPVAFADLEREGQAGPEGVLRLLNIGITAR